MIPKAWIHDARTSRSAEDQSVASALIRAELALRPAENSEFRGPGLVLFDDPAAAKAALGGLALREVERVLAVGAPGATCGPEEAWLLLAAGAADVVCWDELDDAATHIAGRFARWGEIEAVMESSLVRDNLVGSSGAWLGFLRLIVEAALFTDVPVLIAGETGTGKELAARLVHTVDRRPKKKNLVVVDCTTIVPELAGSELFGHERGAYTGAAGSRDGAFALADGGTLFLDEVGELPLLLQAQLLRAVQERTYKRVGGNSWRSAEFRLVCATNRDLAAEVTRGRFRRDLYYRIAGIVARAPTLRERVSDIIPLAEHFLIEQRRRTAGISPAVRALLMTRDYPGNVRDLRQLVHAIGLRHHGDGPITVGDVPPAERPAAGRTCPGAGSDLESAVRGAMATGLGLKDIGHLAEETAMSIALTEAGSVREAAGRLAVTERAIQLRRAARRSRAPKRPGAAESDGEHRQTPGRL